MAGGSNGPRSSVRSRPRHPLCRFLSFTRGSVLNGSRPRQTSSPPSIKPGVKIVDARTAAEINGQNIGNLRRGGFVPSSIPVYWEDLLDPTAKTFKSADELKAIYEAHGILPSQQVIAYCLVGMRASVDLFALHLLGYENLRNYYGAWEEWGNRDDLPLATK